VIGVEYREIDKKISVEERKNCTKLSQERIRGRDTKKFFFVLVARCVIGFFKYITEIWEAEAPSVRIKLYYLLKKENN